MRILVTGANGFVGRHVVASLRHDGNSVTVFDRAGRIDADEDRFAGPGDLADLDTWPNWPGGIEAVLHLAALNPSRGRPASEEALLHANAAGTAALVRRARREGVRRIVFLSTANVHAAGSAPIRESDPLDPRSAYARSKAMAEALFWRELSGGETQGCILRPVPVYGAGGRGNVATLTKLARWPLPLPVEHLGAPRSLLSIAHLVQAISLCLSADDAAGETFLVADDGPETVAGIVRALRQGWGRPERVFALPISVGNILAPKLEARGFGRFVVDSHRLKERTGWRPLGTSAECLSAMARRGEF